MTGHLELGTIHIQPAPLIKSAVIRKEAERYILVSLTSLT